MKHYEKLFLSMQGNHYFDAETWHGKYELNIIKSKSMGHKDPMSVILISTVTQYTRRNKKIQTGKISQKVYQYLLEYRI